MRTILSCSKRIVLAVLAGLLGAASHGETHIVAKGETLYSISRLYKISVQDLCAQNGIGKDDVLRAGQKLLVNERASSATTQRYTVAKDETLYGIAKKFGTDVASLRQLNRFSESYTIKTGESILVPLRNASADMAVASVSGKSGLPLPDLTAADPRRYTSTTKGDSSLVWPVKLPDVSYVDGKVSGVMLSAAMSESVSAIKAGTVMYCGTYRGYGQVVFVQSKTGHIYAYTGFGSTSVKKGDYVVYNDTLGTAGIDAISGKSQIMLMVFQNGKPMDPAKAPRG